MEKVDVIMQVEYYVECPHCRKSKSSVGHLLTTEGKETRFGPWYCDECGGAYEGVAKGKDIYLEKLTERKDRSIIFLKNNNVLLAVKGMYFNGELDAEHNKYFYEEHTCPINYFKNVEMIVDLENGDTDPHGIFEFVGAIPYVDLDEVEDIKQLLPPNIVWE